MSTTRARLPGLSGLSPYNLRSVTFARCAIGHDRRNTDDVVVINSAFEEFGYDIQRQD